MDVSIKTLGIDRLAIADRLMLVEELWDSIADEAGQIPLTDAQRSDLKRRLAAYEANPKSGSSWDAVKMRLQGRA